MVLFVQENKKKNYLCGLADQPALPRCSTWAMGYAERA